MRKKLLFVLLSLVILNPTLALAQGTSLPKYSGVDDTIAQYLCTPESVTKGQELASCINKLYRFGVSFGAIAVVFFMVLAGYLYITGGEGGKQRGKEMLRNALVGMAILLSSYLLLGFINPELTRFKPISPPMFDNPGLPDSCEELGLDEGCDAPEQGAPEGGNSPPPSHFPGPSGTARELATQILARNDITVLCLGDSASCARKNLQDTAAGNSASRSCAAQSISGTTNLSPTLLSGILGLADAMTFTFNINSLAGSCHSGAGSYHYAGRAVDLQTGDISQVNQIHTWCASTAGEHFGPTHNPHPSHAHCAW